MGISVAIKGAIRYIDPPQGIGDLAKAGITTQGNITNFFSLKDSTGEPVSTKALDDVDIFYVGVVLDGTGTTIVGGTLSKGPDAEKPETTDAFKRILNTVRIASYSEASSFVFAHELLHALRDDSLRSTQGKATHESGVEFLMFDRDTTVGFLPSEVAKGRRVKAEDETLAQQSSLVKKAQR